MHRWALTLLPFLEKTFRQHRRPLDFALAQTLAKIAKAFDVLPSFAYYDDTGSPNAYATRRVPLDRADGSVFFGLKFLRKMMNLPEAPEVAVATVSAHEFGHILQFKHSLFSRHV